MIVRLLGQRIHYSWIVAGTTLLTLICAAGFRATPTVLMVPLEHEFGWNAVEDKVHVHDLHATILHLMGIDHRRLTYRYSGRDYRLTDVSGEVVRPILA